jgi:mannose-6-phosphate isomerase-like protein (cupin superfamily)
MTEIVKKGWGTEKIFASNNLYCGKLLNFNQGSKFSMHLHKEKDETWHVLSGSFILKTIDTTSATINVETLNIGDTKHITPMLPHQLMCVEEGTIIEVSTPDSIQDNYRVEKGDSQL